MIEPRYLLIPNTHEKINIYVKHRLTIYPPFYPFSRKITPTHRDPHVDRVNRPRSIYNKKFADRSRIFISTLPIQKPHFSRNIPAVIINKTRTDPKWVLVFISAYRGDTRNNPWLLVAVESVRND